MNIFKHKSGFFWAIGVGTLCFIAGFILCQMRGDFFKGEIVETQQEKELDTLRFVYCTWPPDTMAYVAQEMGYFEKNGLNVELLRMESHGAEIRKRNEVDIWTNTLLDFLMDRSKGDENDSGIFMLQDYSLGADAVIVGNHVDIQTLEELKGKRIGVEKGTVSEFYITYLLQNEGMTLNQVEIVDMPLDEVVSSIEDQKIDVGVVYEPYITESLEKDMTILTDTSNDEGLIVDVYVANQSHMNENPDVYKRFTKSILEAHQYFLESPNEVAALLSKPLDMSEEEVLTSFETLYMPDKDDNKKVFQRSSGTQSFFILLRQARSYLEKQGYVFNGADVESYIYSRIIDSIED